MLAWKPISGRNNSSLSLITGARCVSAQKYAISVHNECFSAFFTFKVLSKEDLLFGLISTTRGPGMYGPDKEI